MRKFFKIRVNFFISFYQKKCIQSFNENVSYFCPIYNLKWQCRENNYSRRKIKIIKKKLKKIQEEEKIIKKREENSAQKGLLH